MRRPVMKKQTSRLLAALKGASPGELLSYDQLAGLIGQSADDIQNGKARAWLTTARKRLLRDDRIVTRCEPGVGVRLLRPEEVLPATSARLKKTRRAAGRAVVDGCTIETKPEGVTDVQWLAHQTRVQIADLIRSNATEGTVKRALVKAANGAQQDIDLSSLKGA